jgi:hypothetical protein
LLEEKPNAGLFTIQEGHADNITWDAYWYALHKKVEKQNNLHTA